MKLDEIERWLLSDQDTVLPAGAVDDDSMDPAGFFAGGSEWLRTTTADARRSPMKTYSAVTTTWTWCHAMHRHRRTR
jgi:hypothetical protein